MKAIRRLTAAELKASEHEIRRQIAENVANLERYIEATVLWIIYEKYGYEAEELEAFLEAFQPALRDLKAFYEVDGQEDTELACIHNLKYIGFDTDKLGTAFPVEYTINGR